ncbi:DDE-type integrase/transposase/recombinase [Shewanella sp. 3B26]|uniref:DDE-type integrase/transposase/recombinase n=1 Tax=Shewanella zhuhaiensis TaxID=2919576 RepID=A0AAJ1BKT6_9GAMM|nr:DNA-binding protein [Shewanella zhuhaiensis]MCH4295604.1 DDE-type integrase/transposase/recombinase [Shewanella zhuhaiensis]
MKEWFTAKELAGLPGLPAADRNIRISAQKGDWISRPRAKGKGLEYHLKSLPPLTQAHLHQQAIQQPERVMATARSITSKPSQAIVTKLEAQSKYLSLPCSKQNVAESRFQLLQEMEQFLIPFEVAGRKTEGVQAFADLHKLSKATLYRWQKAYEAEGKMGLVDTRGGVTASVMADKQLQEFLIALVSAKPHLLNQANELHRLAALKADEHLWKVPSVSAIRRWMNRWHQDNQAAFASLTNPDAYNSKHRPLYGTTYPWLTGPNQVWEFDSTPTDVMLNANGKLRRYALVAAIDVYSRRPMVLVTPSSNAEGICLLLRRCLLTWGMLEEEGLARTDNGSDYVSSRVTGIFDLLGIRQSRTRPFSGWEKPFIERFFGTLSRALFELLPAYIGHSVAERQQIESAKAFAQRIGGKNKAANTEETLALAMTPDELQKMINDWVEYDYLHRVNDGFKGELKGKTPFEVISQSRYTPRHVPNPHALDVLLNHIGDATVIRGSVSAGGIKYTAPELQESAWDRKRVRVFLDPSDVGRATLYALDDWGRCIDAVNLDLVGRDIDPAAFRQARKEDKKVLASFRKATRELQQKFNIDGLAAEALAKAAAERGSLTGFVPKASLTDNPALTALSIPSPSNSENQLERISRESETVAAAAHKVNQTHANAMRTEHEKAEELTLESINRALTEREQAWLKSYRLKYRLFASRLDKLKEDVKKAAN